MGPAEQAAHRLRAAAVDALEEEAKRIALAAAKNVGVGDPAEDPDPYEALRNEWTVTAQPGLRGPVATITFHTAYAKKQHEDQRLKHPRGGKAKYLEDEIKAEIPTLAGKLAQRLRGAI